MATFLALWCSHSFIVLFFSIVGGIPTTFLWSEACHWYLRKFYTDDNSRDRWISITFGVLERALLTTFVLWLSTAAGPFAGAWIAVKAVIGYGDFLPKDKNGRARYAVTLTGSLASILWAVGWGILGTHWN